MQAMSKTDQKGVALAVLLWFIAALSLLVAGIMLTAKTDTRYARLQSSMARITAAADGATLLYLNELTTGGITAGRRVSELAAEGGIASVPVIYEVGPHLVYLRIVPSSGLINMLNADDALLVSLFEIAGGLEAQDAERLAQSVLQWRVSPVPNESGGTQAPRVRVLEDIMKVPGMTRDVFNRIASLVCATCSANLAGANTVVAPFEVLLVLTEGNLLQAKELIGERLASSVAATGLVRIDARIRSDSGLLYQRSTWVNLSGGGAQGWGIKQKSIMKAVSSIDFEALNYVSN